MQQHDLTSLVRAVARIADASDVVVIGTAALLASREAIPEELATPAHVDLFVRDRPELGAQLETALGRGSMFDDEHGICMRAVGPLTPVAPPGWLDRLVPLDAGEAVTAHCMHPDDLVLAKLVAGRGKDIEFAVNCVELAIVDAASLIDRVDALPIIADERARITRTLTGLAA